MLGRVVTIVLIAAVIACPLSCGKGACLAGTCCRTERSQHDDCPACGNDSCCGGDKGTSFDDTRSDSDDTRTDDTRTDDTRTDDTRTDDGGCPCPVGDSPCQGVCGGAVFEKPVQVNDQTGRSSFLADFSSPFVCLSEGLLGARHDDGGRLFDHVHGRFLRVLHMSFLC